AAAATQPTTPSSLFIDNRWIRRVGQSSGAIRGSEARDRDATITQFSHLPPVPSSSQAASCTVRPPTIPTLLRSWPLPLLLVSLALTGLAAFDAHRAVASQDATVQRAMREFSSFAAWSYDQKLQERLGVMLREALGAVNHGDNLHMEPPVPRAQNLAHILPFDTRCDCHRTRFGPNPAALFAFRLGEDSLEVAVNTHPDPAEGWEVDRPPMAVLPAGATPNYTRAERRWIVDTISRQVHAQT